MSEQTEEAIGKALVFGCALVLVLWTAYCFWVWGGVR